MSEDHEQAAAPGPSPEPTEGTRSFSLKSAEANEALCPRADRPWIPNGALPREPRWPRGGEGVWVDAGDGEAAEEAFGEWRRHVEAGRILITQPLLFPSSQARSSEFTGFSPGCLHVRFGR
jgi:hypothetical protein